MLQFGGRSDEAPLGDIVFQAEHGGSSGKLQLMEGVALRLGPSHLGTTGRPRPQGTEPQRGLQHGAGPRPRKRVSTQCLNRSFPFLIHWYNGRFVMRILGALLLCSALGQGAAQVNSITFEQNRGQSNRETRYIARCQGSAFLIEDNAIVFARSGRNGNLRAARLQFEGAGLIAAWQSLDPVTGTTSYIVG